MTHSLRQHYFRILLKHKGMALLGVFLAVITAYAGIALLAVSGWFISAAALAGLSAVAAHQFDFFSPGAMVRGLSIARTFGRYGERLSSHEATFRVISHLRSDLFRMISRQGWQEIQLNRHQSASRLMQDIQYIESIYLSAVVPAVVALATVLGYLLMIWLVLPQSLGYVVALLLLTVVAMPLLYSHRVLINQDRLHQQRSEQWQASSSLLSNLRTLTLHQRLNHAGDHLTQQGQTADQKENDAIDQQQSVLLIANLLLAGLAVVVFWQGFEAWQMGRLIPANLFMLLLLSLGTGEVLITTSPVLAAWQLGMKALQRLQTEYAREEAVEDRRVFDTRHQPHSSVRVQQLGYHYPATGNHASAAIFEHFNYDFAGPGWYWICGPSGRGKSTLINLLAGELQATAGTIMFSGVMQTDVVLMPQQVDILKASVRDNLTLHHSTTDDEIRKALTLVELDDWVDGLPQGLNTWLGDGEWQPSGGETKRIGLARLLLMKPSVALLDEPTAGMDAAMAERIFQRLAVAWQDTLVIANTHDRQLIQPGQQSLEL